MFGDVENDGTEGGGLDGTAGAGLGTIEGVGLDGTKEGGLDGTEGAGLEGTEGGELDGIEGTGLDGTERAGLGCIEGEGLDGTKGAGLDGVEGAGLGGIEGVGLDGTEGGGLGGTKGACLGDIEGAGLDGTKGAGLGRTEGSGPGGVAAAGPGVTAAGFDVRFVIGFVGAAIGTGAVLTILACPVLGAAAKGLELVDTEGGWLDRTCRVPSVVRTETDEVGCVFLSSSDKLPRWRYLVGIMNILGTSVTVPAMASIWCSAACQWAIRGELVISSGIFLASSLNFR